MKTKLINVARGKKVNTKLDFCKVFGDLDVFKKSGVIKNLQLSVDTNKTISGKPLKETELPAVKQLLKWCTVNLLIGNELCPPENLNKY